MEKIGVLLVSYGSRAASFADALCRSENYKVEIFDADKQRNPFILERSKEYQLGLDIEKISQFATKHKEEIDFGIVVVQTSPGSFLANNFPGGLHTAISLREFEHYLVKYLDGGLSWAYIGQTFDYHVLDTGVERIFRPVKVKEQMSH